MNIFLQKNKKNIYVYAILSKVSKICFVVKSSKVYTRIFYATYQKRKCPIQNRLSSFMANHKNNTFKSPSPFHLLCCLFVKINIYNYISKETHTRSSFISLIQRGWQIQLLLIYYWNMDTVMALMIFLRFPGKIPIISIMNYIVSWILYHLYCHIFIIIQNKHLCSSLLS